MVMINSATGFRRTDLAKIALARSYGAVTFQIFTKIRFPLALPMIIVGLMVGAIFGLLTAVGAEMVGGKNGLGNQLMFCSSLIKMENFWAIIVLLALMGISIYVIFYWVGKKWAELAGVNGVGSRAVGSRHVGRSTDGGDRRPRDRRALAS